MIIELPWPPRQLSPNNKSAWQSKIKVKNGYKQDAFEQAFMLGYKIEGNIPISIMFHPPNRLKRDLDNMLASIKYGLDGVASALRINDYQFRPMTLDVGEPIKGGKIIITLPDMENTRNV